MPVRTTLAAILLGVTCLAGLSAGRAAAGPTLLIEASSGKVLYAEDLDDQWHPASLTKIMTAYLVFEAIKAGKLTLEARIPYSEAAAAQPPSKIGLQVGAEIAVETALRALIIKSANDIAVTLAEAVGGTEAQFVEKMNATARRLGMSRTKFSNPNGLPAPDQVTTARDLARLSRAVMRDFPEHSPFWAEAEMRLGKQRIPTHNGLLKSMEGADGIKTGFICDSGYNVVASASRDGVRLMAVVLGEVSAADRTIRAQALLEHGYATLGWKSMFIRDTIDNLAIAPDAKAAASIRSTVMAYACGNRKIQLNRVAAARNRAKQRAMAQKASANGAKGSTAAAATPGVAKAKAAPGGAVGSSAGSSGTPAAKPAPKPKPAAPAPSGEAR